MTEFWEGGREAYLRAIRTEYSNRIAKLRQQLERSDSPRERQMAMMEIARLRKEFREKERNLKLLF